MLDKIKANMFCLDDDLVQLQGDFETEISQALVIQFAFCEKNTDGVALCLDFKTSQRNMGGNYVVFLANQRALTSLDSGGFSVEEYSRLFWAPINTSGRME
mmetsp:Transcript_28511/g.35214  ORF Transcript_28511/g.35214 Transcript_28511/m.35214 type:complete len:101 (-) Transcript_28511:1615-1917(-)